MHSAPSDSFNGEIQGKDILIEELTIENDQLRTELEKVKAEAAKQAEKLRDQEDILEQCQEKMATVIPESDRLTTDLQCQVDELTTSNKKLEEEVLNLRKKVQSLQVELDNSEAVQRDFVKLSQSLQVCALEYHSSSLTHHFRSN